VVSSVLTVSIRPQPDVEADMVALLRQLDERTQS